jgi:ribose transport system substrate-binding protein
VIATRRILVLLAALVVGVVAGCGGDEETAADPATTDAAAAAESGEPLRIAFLTQSAANTWLLKSKEAMERVAEERGAELTEFDSEFSVEKQAQQLQDVIASQRYDGIILGPGGPSLIADVQDALDAGIKVVVMNQVLGDRLDTAEPQIEGLAASILAAPEPNGERSGKMTVAACEGKDPCRVVYFYGIKGGPGDVAYRKGFDTIVEPHDSIEVVAEGEGKYLGPEYGLQQMQDILQRVPDFDVVVGNDQTMQGVEQALEEAGKLDSVEIIGLGGSRTALERIKAKRWFGTVYGAPQTEGELAMNAILDAVEHDKVTGAIETLSRFPEDGMVTQDNVDEFEPQWEG